MLHDTAVTVLNIAIFILEYVSPPNSFLLAKKTEHTTEDGGRHVGLDAAPT